MSDTALVINSGRRPGEYQRIDPPAGHPGGSGLIKRTGEPERCATHNYAGSTTAFTAVITDHGRAERIMQEWFDDAGSPAGGGVMAAVGHRVARAAARCR